MEYLNDKLHLPATGMEQDWELELSDSNRISEFVAYLEGGNLDGECQEAMVGLILASFNEAIHRGEFSEIIWRKFCDLIRDDIVRFMPVISPWLGEDDGDVFEIRCFLLDIIN